MNYADEGVTRSQWRRTIAKTWCNKSVKFSTVVQKRFHFFEIYEKLKFQTFICYDNFVSSIISVSP